MTSLWTSFRRLLPCSLCFLAVGLGSVWDGVFTKEQAARGKTVYGEECARCHAENLMGGEGAPALAGGDFLNKWNGRNVGELLGTIAKTMPSEDPGSLSRRQYADIAAHILSENGFPAGAKELASAPDAVNDVMIEKKK